jgi:hypothetical protein
LELFIDRNKSVGGIPTLWDFGVMENSKKFIFENNYYIRYMRSNTLKSTIIKNIASLDDVQLLREINALLVQSKRERKIHIPEEKEKEIAIAREQFKNGNFLHQEDVEKRFSKWKD